MEIRNKLSFEDLRGDFGNTLPPSLTDFSHIIQENVVGPAYLYQFDLAVKHIYSSEWKECQALSKCLLDITWEHLNTGHWKDVHITWRHSYTYLSLLKALCEYAISKEGGELCTMAAAVKTCDMGLLMGAPVLDNVLTRIVGKLQRCWAEDNSKFASSQKDGQHG